MTTTEDDKLCVGCAEQIPHIMIYPDDERLREHDKISYLCTCCETYAIHEVCMNRAEWSAFYERDHEWLCQNCDENYLAYEH